MIAAMIIAATATTSRASVAVERLIDSVNKGDRAAFAAVAPDFKLMIGPDIALDFSFEETKEIVTRCTPMSFAEIAGQDARGKTVLQFRGLCRVDDGPRPSAVDFFVTDGKVRGFQIWRTD